MSSITHSTPTIGVRTWRRTHADPSAPLAERVTETTRTGDVAEALASADFVTIPRLGPNGPGYDDAYAEAFSRAPAERFGYAGGRRVSASGQSHVFERERAQNGVSIDFGLPGQTGASPQPLSRIATAGGDGLSRGIPALASR